MYQHDITVTKTQFNFTIIQSTLQSVKQTNKRTNLEDRHAIDGGVLVVLRGGVDAVVRTNHDRHVRFLEVVVNFVCRKYDDDDDDDDNGSCRIPYSVYHIPWGGGGGKRHMKTIR